METRIYKTLSQWFPEAFSDFDHSEDMNLDYGVLRHFATFTQKLIQDKSERIKEPFKIINLIYSKSTMFEKNAIENEFFNAFANSEKSMTLKQHLDLMPESLRGIYIRTILEN